MSSGKNRLLPFAFLLRKLAARGRAYWNVWTAVEHDFTSPPHSCSQERNNADTI